MDEQLLIDGCKRGEASARKELYELYAPAMMSVCARYVHDRETARDLLQDGFGSYRNPEGLKYNHLPKYLLHLPISLLIVFKYLL